MYNIDAEKGLPHLPVLNLSDLVLSQTGNSSSRYFGGLFFFLFFTNRVDPQDEGTNQEGDNCTNYYTG